MKDRREKKRLGERLVEAGLIDEIQLAVALGMQKQTGLKIGKQLLKLGFIDEEELSPFLSEQTDMSISLAQRKISPQTLKAVPQDLAFKYKVIPVAFDGKTIVLAMSDPKDITVIDDLAFRLAKKIHPVRALEWDIDTALLKYYSGFTDDELSKLTSSSNAASQYQDAQWLEKDEQYIELSKGIDAQADAHNDITDLLVEGDTPELYMPGPGGWPEGSNDGPEGAKPEAANPDKFAPNPLHELEPKPSKASAPPPSPKPAAPQPKQAAPQAPSPRPKAPAQPQAKAALPPRPAQPTKQQTPPSPRPQTPKEARTTEPEKTSAESEAISALANTARKRFTVQQALIDLLIEKKLITERDLLNKLLKLEGALGSEEE